MTIINPVHTHTNLKGRVYVKGMLTQQNAKMHFCYNFNTGKLTKSRDRQNTIDEDVLRKHVRHALD